MRHETNSSGFRVSSSGGCQDDCRSDLCCFDSQVGFSIPDSRIQISDSGLSDLIAAVIAVYIQAPGDEPQQWIQTEKYQSGILQEDNKLFPAFEIGDFIAQYVR